MANYKDLRHTVFPASSIASGTFNDARIAASNVSQHVTAFDDNKIVNDFSTLGLSVHIHKKILMLLILTWLLSMFLKMFQV